MWRSACRRNELALLNLIVNGITLMFAVVAAVTGAFGMNLNAWMPQGTRQSAVRPQNLPVTSACAPIESRRARFPAPRFAFAVC